VDTRRATDAATVERAQFEEGHLFAKLSNLHIRQLQFMILFLSARLKQVDLVLDPCQFFQLVLINLTHRSLTVFLLAFQVLHLKSRPPNLVFDKCALAFLLLLRLLGSETLLLFLLDDVGYPADLLFYGHDLRVLILDLVY